MAMFVHRDVLCVCVCGCVHVYVWCVCVCDCVGCGVEKYMCMSIEGVHVCL